MLVLCLEGAHGAGKSSFIDYLEKQGYSVLDEAFLDQPEYGLHPQTLTMEFNWVSNWLMRLLRVCHELPVELDKKTIFVADRSPYSAELYSRKNGHLLKPVIDAQIAELFESARIKVLTVHITCDSQTLWNRIQDRLRLEPERKRYGEHRHEWMTQAKEFYDNHGWDHTIDNSNKTFVQMKDELVSIVKNTFNDYPIPGENYFSPLKVSLPTRKVYTL
ncbi:hypothetical protein PCE1_004539 [Barthelona sp. PCE]